MTAFSKLFSMNGWVLAGVPGAHPGFFKRGFQVIL